MAKSKITEGDNTHVTLSSNYITIKNFEDYITEHDNKFNTFKEETLSDTAHLTKSIFDLDNRISDNDKHDTLIDMRIETLRKHILGLIATNIVTIIAIIVLFIIK